MGLEPVAVKRWCGGLATAIKFGNGALICKAVKIDTQFFNQFSSQGANQGSGKLSKSPVYGFLLAVFGVYFSTRKGVVPGEHLKVGLSSDHEDVAVEGKNRRYRFSNCH